MSTRHHFCQRFVSASIHADEQKCMTDSCTYATPNDTEMHTCPLLSASTSVLEYIRACFQDGIIMKILSKTSPYKSFCSHQQREKLCHVVRCSVIAPQLLHSIYLSTRINAIVQFMSLVTPVVLVPEQG